MLLNVHSYYSLRYGVLAPEDLVALLRKNGYAAAVLTDINNSTAVLEFVKRCAAAGIKGLAGMEFRNGDELLYIAIARNLEGFGELNEYRTLYNRLGAPVPAAAPDWRQVFVVYPFGKKTAGELKAHEFIGVRPEERNKARLEPQLRTGKYLVWQALSFSKDADIRLHRQLRAIDHNLLISQLKPGNYTVYNEMTLPGPALRDRYAEFPELLAATDQLLDQCCFDFPYGTNRNKQTFSGSREEDLHLLETAALQGLEDRYGELAVYEEARSRIFNELEVIRQQAFAGYFLITHDITSYARRNKIQYVGRGSGANSIVAYCLHITDVCPLTLNLYFERFLNPRRQVPPDFDIDFCWNERDLIHDYIFSRYEHVALQGAMSTFRDRSIIRELGKVYGLPKAEIDRMIYDPGSMLNKNEVCNTILSVYAQMEKFPNQRTIHASGVIISEYPLSQVCALDYPPKGRPTLQIDMYMSEDAGFDKFDILSQRGLGHIRDCIRLAAENKGAVADISRPHELFEDRQLNQQLKTGNTIGCFYIESPAMRQLLVKLQCDNYRTLVAASSIIRPGVSGSGMMKAYIERHRNPDTIPYLHEVMKAQLAETYGVMVYQEDVMKVGHYFGGLDMADADVLRRMMSGKHKHPEQMQEIRLKFFAHARGSGCPEDTIAEVWRQMESFAGFSFNKAHSASYAVESYQSLYLKNSFPMEFMVAVLNNYGGFYNRKLYVQETRKTGACIHLPCVNRSDIQTTISGADVYLGFDHLLNLEQQVCKGLITERRRNGPYTGLENLLRRSGISLEQVVILIRTGALRFTGSGKKELLWEAHLLLSEARAEKAPLFPCLVQDSPQLPMLEHDELEDLYDELELLGFPVSGTMFAFARSNYRGDVMAAALPQLEGQTVRMVGDFVTDKKVYTKRNEYMKFGTFSDVNGDLFDTVHFPPSLALYPLQGNGVYLISGKVILDFGSPSVEVDRIARIPLRPDPRTLD